MSLDAQMLQRWTNRHRQLWFTGAGTDTTHLTKLTATFTAVVVLLTSVVVPRATLAFEAALPTATAARLVTPVQLAERATLPELELAQVDTTPGRLVGTVVATAMPDVPQSTWPTQRLARASESVSTRVVPSAEAPLVLEGEASYYSRAGCLGCSPALRMANGQPLDDGALTMAIGADKKHLVGHRATVTNMVTGQSVEVIITDTGGFYKARYGNRVADLTIATKQAIGMAGGVGQVRVEVY